MTEYAEYGEPNGDIDPHFSSAQMFRAYCIAAAFGGE